MSYVAYNSQKIIPAPLVNIKREWRRTEDGSRTGQRILITLSGKFVSGKGGLYSGSGYPSDVPADRHCFKDILAKQESLQELFDNTDYQWLEILPDPEATATPTKWVVKVLNVDFPQGQWVETTDYIVQLEAQVGDTTNDYDTVVDYDETWELQYNEDPNDTYNLVHNIHCTSQEQYVVALASIKDGWIKAYEYVNDTLGGSGIDNTIVQADPGFALAVTFAGYNHVLTKNIDEFSGVYNIQETWLMSETTYSEDQQIEVVWNRDTPESEPDTTVSISGTITGLRNDAGTGYANAQTRWTVVEDGLYSQANSITPGVTIAQTPKTKSVTYNELDRTINYIYTYDNTSADYLHDQTITVSTSDGDCDRITVDISGTVTGIENDVAGTSAWDNAQTGWAASKGDLYTNADGAYTLYGGAGTLRTEPSESREGYNEFNGTITYNYSYHDWADAYVHNQTLSTNYDKTSDRGTVGIEGNIVAWCADGYSAALSYFQSNWGVSNAYAAATSYYVGNSSLAAYPRTTRVSYNEIDRQINYNYEFDDFDNSADEDITYTIETDQAQCGYNLGRIDGSITGKGDGISSGWTNANTAFAAYATADPSLISTYLPGAKFLSKSVTYNEFNNRINFTFSYTDQSNSYVIDETVTRTQDPSDCGYEGIIQTGTVTGFCDDGTGSAYDNAVIGLAAITTPSGVGTRMRSSVGHNENRGTIQYTYEYTSRAEPYIIDQTITENTELVSKGRRATYTGTVIGLCTGNPPSAGIKYTNAVTGWAVHEPTIDPTTDIGGANWTRTMRSVGRNEKQGVINFSLEYSEHSLCLTGALSESIQIAIEEPSDIFAIVSILGGPSVIQDKGGTSVARKTITIDARFEPNSSCAITGEPSATESIIDSAEPSADVVVVERNTKNWNPRTGQYNRSKTWVYADCSS